MSNYNPPDPLPPPLTIFNNVNWEVPDVISGGGGGAGPQGIAGPIGPQGLQGNQGIVGVQGSQGSQGILGLQGIVGLQGNQGWQGIVGAGTQGNQGWQGIVGSGTQGQQGLQGTAGGGGGGDTVSFVSDVSPAQVAPIELFYQTFRTMTVPSLATDGDYVDVFDTGYFLKFGGAPTAITAKYRLQRNGVDFFTTQNIAMTGFTSADDFQCPYTLRMRLTRLSATSTGFEGRLFCGSVANDVTAVTTCAIGTTNIASQLYTLGTPHTLTFSVIEDASTYNGQHVFESTTTTMSAFLQ